MNGIITPLISRENLRRMIEISNFALASLLPRPLLPIAWLEERENWISKTQSEMVSCGGDEDLHFKQIGTHHSPELLLESDIPSLVWVHYILTFSIGNMLPEPSLPTTCSSALFAEQKICFYNKFFILPCFWAGQKEKGQEILFHSPWKEIFICGNDQAWRQLISTDSIEGLR